MIYAEVTIRGRKLADLVNPALGATTEIRRICSLLTRHATTYARIQRLWTDVELSAKETERYERREAQLEKRMTDLVLHLPETDDGRITIRFGGDPRGFSVTLVMPGRYADLHNNWNRDGIGVDF